MVVGSTCVIGPGDDQDVDIVLISDVPCAKSSEPVTILAELLCCMKGSDALSGCQMWLVNAAVPIIKVHGDRESADLLWLPVCRVAVTSGTAPCHIRGKRLNADGRAGTPITP
jgi:hypothetical protein